MLLAVMAPGGPLLADTLELTNGDTLSGTLVKTETAQVVWESPVLGTLNVTRSNIAAVNGQPLPTPPSLHEPRYEWEGKVDVGVEKDEGSSNSEEYELGLRTSLTHGRYVHTLTLEHEAEKKRSTTTEEDYEFQYQADRYFRTAKKGPYLYGRTHWNKDRFRATDEWFAVGSGAGYVWRPKAGTRIKLQGGLDFWKVSLQSDNRSTTGGRVMVDLRHRFRRLANLLVFTEIQFLWEIGGANNRVIETDSGVRVPLSERFFTELSLDYDRFETSDDPEFSENDETEWNLKLGYRW